MVYGSVMNLMGSSLVPLQPVLGQEDEGRSLRRHHVLDYVLRVKVGVRSRHYDPLSEYDKLGPRGREMLANVNDEVSSVHS